MGGRRHIPLGKCTLLRLNLSEGLSIMKNPSLTGASAGGQAYLLQTSYLLYPHTSHKCQNRQGLVEIIVIYLERSNPDFSFDQI